MGSSTIKDKFINVNNVIEKLRDLFKCQICFSIKDEDSIVFYWRCQHFYCSDCVSKDLSCVICDDVCNVYETDDSYETGERAKLTDNENILTIFRLLRDYESSFLLNEIKGKDTVEAASSKRQTSKNESVLDVSGISKRQKSKNDSVLDVSGISKRQKSKNESILDVSGISKRQKSKNESILDVSGISKRQKSKNDSVLDVSGIDDKNNSHKKKKGLNVSKRNYKGETPLHLACKKGNLSLMQDLIDAGASPNVQDNAGWTPLHDAIAFGRIDVIKFLLKNGARVNTPGHENTTPLHQAVTERNSEVIRLLMKYGADKNARDIYGQTPKDIVIVNKLTELEEIMMTTPAKFKPQNRILDTSLLQMSNTVLYGYNLSENDTSLLERFASKFKYKTVERLSLQSPATHIVTSDSKPKITWSIIQGVLMACHVLDIQWMEDSMANNTLQPIEKYEMTGESYVGFEKTRENHLEQLPGLFSGCHFFFGGNFEIYKTKNSSFPKTELKLLVEKNGGVILTRNPDPESLNLEKTIPYHASVDGTLSKTSYYIIYSKELWDPAPKYNMTHMKTLPVEWLLASMYKFELIDPSIDQSYMEYI